MADKPEEPYKTGPKKPPLEHRIKKGQVLNPLGARAHDPVVKKFKNLTNEEMMEVGSLIVKGNVEALKDILKDPNASVLQVWIARVAIKAMAQGDMKKLDTLLNRLVGKVKEQIHHTGFEGQPQIVVTLPDNGRQ